MFRPHDLVQLKGLLHRRRVLALLGAAGSGKSVLFDDLSEALVARGMAAKAGRQWRVLRPKPGPDILASMARELSSPGLLVPEGHKPPADLHHTLLELLQDETGHGLQRVMKTFPYLQATNLLLIFDPMDGIYQAEVGEDTRHVVGQMVQSIGKESQLPLYLLMGMRPKLYDDLYSQPIGAWLEDPYVLYPLEQPTIRRLIEQELADIATANELKYRVEPALLDYLSKTLSHPDGQLQRLNDELQDFRELLPKIDKFSWLDFKLYRQYRGLTEAVEDHATTAAQVEEWYLALPQVGQESVRRIFQALVQPRIKGDPPANRPLPLKRLSLIVGQKPSLVLQWLRPLQESRMQMITPARTVPLEANSLIGLVHAPADHPWARLREWMREESERASFYLQLSQRAKAVAEGESQPLNSYQHRTAQQWWQTQKPHAAWASLYADNYRQVKDFVQAQPPADSSST